eukprot:Seg1904.7 transcript_id=Seg1904.7/GoldUCD/mRNA.D3Y31 product="hypothetical protein" protein_id=Seg1904.7/GoldUCD/D3Y31
MRRNLLTSILWFTAIVLFLLHLILVRKQDEKSFGDLVYRQQKDLSNTESPTAQKSTEPQKAHTTKEVTKRPKKDETIIKDYISNIEKLKKEVTGLKRKEKQLKSLARRLASKLKGKESGTLPKLDPKIPWIFAITPTYSRFTQKADLIRLSHTLLHVTNLHWILVEDHTFRTDLVSRLLQETGLSFTHLNYRTPPEMQRKRGEPRRKHHRGVAQRNLGLKWLKENVDPDRTPGSVYFMDDDNTYHTRIFDEMRWTKGVSVWPVGLSGAARFAGPIVRDGKVVDFHTNWAPNRSFPLDMAGFSVNLKVLVKERPWVQFDQNTKRGYLEPTFLEQLTTREELEPLADNCTKVLVWHTRTEVAKESIRGERQLIKLGRPSDITIET